MVSDDGERISDNLFSVGSGSIYAYSILDAGYKYEMSTVDAIDLARRAIVHAAHRDAASGNIVRSESTCLDADRRTHLVWRSF